MVIFENRRQARKVRWIQLGAFAWAAGLMYWAFSLSATYGLSPGDGGVLRPAFERYSAAVIVAVTALAPLVGMLVYALQVYLVRIERQRDAVLLVMIGLLRERPRVMSPDAFTGSHYHAGRKGGRISVDAPWISLYVADRWLPYIVDMKADFVNRSAIEAMAGRNRQPRRSGQAKRTR